MIALLLALSGPSFDVVTVELPISVIGIRYGSRHVNLAESWDTDKAFRINRRDYLGGSDRWNLLNRNHRLTRTKLPRSVTFWPGATWRPKAGTLQVGKRVFRLDCLAEIDRKGLVFVSEVDARSNVAEYFFVALGSINPKLLVHQRTVNPLAVIDRTGSLWLSCPFPTETPETFEVRQTVAYRFDLKGKQKSRKVYQGNLNLLGTSLNGQLMAACLHHPHFNLGVLGRNGELEQRSDLVNIFLPEACDSFAEYP